MWNTCRALGTSVFNVPETFCLGLRFCLPPRFLRSYQYKWKHTFQSEQKIPIQTIAQRGLKSSTQIQTQKSYSTGEVVIAINVLGMT